MHNPLLSIIIPLYNKEDYVGRCVSSILDQDFTDMELIIVDDGSTDESANIIKRQFKDKRINLIQGENRGVSEARNRGIDEAKGDYVMFIDADDYISQGYIKNIAKEIKEHEADIYVWGITKDAADGKQKKKVLGMSGMFQQKEFIHQMVAEQYYRNMGIMGYISNKTLRRSFINGYNIRFDKNIKLMEDYNFFLDCYANINSACCFDECGYHYVDHPQPQNGKNKTVDYISLIDTHRKCLSIIEQTTENEEDRKMVIHAIGQLSLAMFLEMHPTTMANTRHHLDAMRQRPECHLGIESLNTNKRILQHMLLNDNKIGVLLYLKCWQTYLKARTHK